MTMKDEEITSYWAVNLTRMGSKHSAHDYREKFHSWRNESGARCYELLLPLLGTGVAFGPFDAEKNALAMAASDLIEEKDFFGDRWAIIEGVSSIGTDFFKPRANESRVYVCSDQKCDGVQRFKGSCSKCKFSGKELVPTREIRDWDGRLEGRL